MLEPVDSGFPLPRAFLCVGGASVARHQLGLAMAMKCQRVICVARGLSPELIELQHDAEAAGMQFHIVADARGLSRLVTANDELLVLGEGLLAARDEAVALLDAGHVVLAQPVEAGLAAGFERIDINHATAGAMRIPGRLVAHLAELPADCDIVSALTRLALQAGLPVREVPAELRDGVRWRLVRGEMEAHALEGEWIRRQIGAQGAKTPGAMLAWLGVLGFGPALLHAGKASSRAYLACMAAMLLALGSGWLDMPAAGFGLCAVAAILRQAGDLLGRAERSARAGDAAPRLRDGLLGWAIDMEIVLLATWPSPLSPGETQLHHVFAPLLLMLLVRLVPHLLPAGWGDWLEDRVPLAIVLALAVSFGVIDWAVQLLALLVALAAIMFGDGKSRLTRP